MLSDFGKSLSWGINKRRKVLAEEKFLQASFGGLMITIFSQAWYKKLETLLPFLMKVCSFVICYGKVSNNMYKSLFCLV